MKNLDELMLLGNDMTVLYVEDDKNLRKEMYEILNDLFSHVILAGDGNEGLEKFLSWKKENGEYPDIIISDINMPHVSGVELSKKILAYHPEQLIIVLSAHNETDHLLELINMGIDAYLLKPVCSDKFLQTLQRACKKIYYKKMYERHMEKLETFAYTDAMTGISNRRRFFEKAHTLFHKDRSKHLPVYLFMMDIDKFKEINDTYGHDVGDEVIRVLVNIVKNELSSNDCFARIGGDEFILLMQMSQEKALYIREKIQNNIFQTHSLLGNEVKFTVSMGMTHIEESDQDIDTVIKRADINLYNEKREKKRDAQYLA